MQIDFSKSHGMETSLANLCRDGRRWKVEVDLLHRVPGYAVLRIKGLYGYKGAFYELISLHRHAGGMNHRTGRMYRWLALRVISVKPGKNWREKLEHLKAAAKELSAVRT